MIELLGSSLLHLLASGCVPCHAGVTLVEALGGNLAGVIYAHQSRGVTFLLSGQFLIGDILSRIRASLARAWCRQGAQTRIDSCEEAIQWIQLA
jgi:hypothetical protein